MDVFTIAWMGYRNAQQSYFDPSMVACIYTTKQARDLDLFGMFMVRNSREYHANRVSNYDANTDSRYTRLPNSNVHPIHVQLL